MKVFVSVLESVNGFYNVAGFFCDFATEFVNCFDFAAKS